MLGQNYENLPGRLGQDLDYRRSAGTANALKVGTTQLTIHKLDPDQTLLE